MTEKPFTLLTTEETNTQSIINRKLQKLSYDTQAFGATTKHLRTIESTANTLNIEVSAFIDYQQKTDIVQAGFDMYCLKPLDYEKLFRISKTYLKKRQQENRVGA